MHRTTAITAGLLLSVSFASTAHSDLLDDIRSEGTFTVGTEARFAPFEYIEDGDIVGYSADIMEHIMPELGEDVELIRMDLPWQGILPGLERERFDYVVTSVTATPERMERYHLSAPIADATMAILKRTGEDDISSLKTSRASRGSAVGVGAIRSPGSVSRRARGGRNTG